MSLANKALQGLGVLIPLSYKQHTPSPFVSSFAAPWSKTKKKGRESKSKKRNRLHLLENEPVPQLFQNNPDLKAIGFPPSGWTRTLEGFFKSANNREKAVLRNNRMLRQKFTRLVNINLFAPRHPALINRDFKAFLKNLEAHGLSGHWTIQISRSNVVHWHLLFVNCQMKPRHLKRLVKRCLAAVETFPRHRVYADRVRNQRQTLDYVLQVKKAGYGEVRNPLEKGSPRRTSISHNIYAKERVLFKPKTGLHKNGTFGKFWAEGYNEKKIWKLICEEAATVARNYENPRIKTYVHQISNKLGIPLSWVRWRTCLNPPAELLEGASESASQKAPIRVRSKPNRRSPGLIGLVFRSGRHAIPAIERSKPVLSRLLLASIIQEEDKFCCGRPASKDPLEATYSEGLRNALGTWIRSLGQLFHKKQIRSP